MWWLILGIMFAAGVIVGMVGVAVVDSFKGEL
jgi:hypothetical protein